MDMSAGAAIALGGVTMTSLVTMGKMMYNYGRDRKELNGTVERVKSIDMKLDKHISDERNDMTQMHENIKEIATKVDLLVQGRIKDK